jgi:UDP-N-acetylglucosamine acyltransferase
MEVRKINMVQVHPSAVVDNDAQLGDGVVIGPNCVVSSGVRIGSGTVIESNVVICNDVTIGSNNRFSPNCVIGCPPQVLGLTDETGTGGVIIGDGNTIREHVTIHRSRYEDATTALGNDNLLMVGSHLGHDCVVEDHTVLSNYVQLGGHCKIGTGVWLSGVVFLNQFVTIGKWCYAAGLAGINKDVPPFLIVSGHYPPRVRNVNKRGMDRAGLDEQQQQNIIEAFEKLYRRGGALLENANLLAQEDGLDENVRAMIDAILKSSQHRYGRYLETLRR